MKDARQVCLDPEFRSVKTEGLRPELSHSVFCKPRHLLTATVSAESNKSSWASCLGEWQQLPVLSEPTLLAMSPVQSGAFIHFP